jgi:hypothetical protein
MKIRIVKFIQCGLCSINGPKFSTKFIFWNFLHYNRAFDFCHTHTLCTLVPKVFVVRILGQNLVFKHSLWILELFFSLRDKIMDFFQDLVGILKLVQIWHVMHKIVP